MPAAYSTDFRKAVIAYVEAGHSCSGAASVFSTSRSFVIRLIQQYRTTGEFGVRPRGGARHSKLIDHQDKIIGWINNTPDITLREIAELLLKEEGITASSSGLSDLLCRAGYTYKKIIAGKRSRAWQTPKQANKLDKPATALHGG